MKAWRVLILTVALALVAGACGADTDSDVSDVARPEVDDIDTDLNQISTALSQGFGALGQAQRQAIDQAATSEEPCDRAALPRRRPEPSQVEVEIVSLVDGCLEFSYDVAGFRSLVDDIQTFRDQDGVIGVSPLLLRYHLNQAAPDWPLDAVSAIEVLASDAPTGDGVVIAIIDTGIDTSYSHLSDVTIERVPGSGSGDYIATGHGTIAAAIVSSPIGSSPRGLASASTLLDVPADLCGPDQCACAPCASMTPAEAVRYSVDHGADIISMSFGYRPEQKPAWWALLLDAEETASATETLEIALEYATASGRAMVAAAGNCGSGTSARCAAQDQFEIPAGHSDVIAVGALRRTTRGQITAAGYSTSQSYVELSAPGSLSMPVIDGEPSVKNGTSYSTPFVAAALALLIGNDGPLVDHPDRRTIARGIMVDTASDVAPSGRDSQYGHGILQLDAALDAAVGYAIDNPVPTPTTTAEN